MHGPPDTQMGRGMLLFAAIMAILALWVSLGRGAWVDAGLWYALAVFFACFGTLMAEVPEHWHRPLLIVGLGAGIIAFGFALRMAGVAFQ